VSFQPGQVVECTVISVHTWGVIVQIAGAPEQKASIDLFSVGLPPRSVADVPEVGTSLRAVVVEERRDSWLRLSHRDDDVALAETTGAPPSRFRAGGGAG
jgi:hypothetical protein